eukprot:gnl/TRDRNA2_/TRDRNA2_155168_c4_seq1.p1 gnl/TRDRNA2_/TRDRNA2_155168_c4~~gnl/TRDRNA2_/TRDRNA2_155168_c4_seq1.p1  ORF type:complete len:892 (+),score=105.23 gnl/TRDRNA2_/TRDRNA2_155168_c4_seq1:27-2702(+)
MIQVAGPGIPAASLTPRYGFRKDQVIHISTDQLYIDRFFVMLYPAKAVPALAPGEVYSLTISDKAFMDLSFNTFAGLKAGYTISTRRHYFFMEASSKEWAGGIPGYDGSRFGGAGIVDNVNRVYMIGGANGTKKGAAEKQACMWTLQVAHCAGLRFNADAKTPEACREACCSDDQCQIWQFDGPVHTKKCFMGTSFQCGASMMKWKHGGRKVRLPSNNDQISKGSLLNDVWSYHTRREAHCGSSFVPFPDCPQSTCSIGPDGVANMGYVHITKTVWRAPSLGGLPCMGEEAEVRDLWAEVVTEEQACPCPLCLQAPGPPVEELPSFMVNTSYVDAYTLVSASGATRDLLCQPGKVANGSFTCEIESVWLGRYVTPYPQCFPAPCTVPPDLQSVRNMAYSDVAGSTDKINCAYLSDVNPMPSQGLCAIKCMPGYEITTGGFACFEGQLSEAICDPQVCDIESFGLLNGRLNCSQGSAYPNACPVVCEREYRTNQSGRFHDIYYSMGPPVVAACVAESSEPEAKVFFQLSHGTPETVCELILCHHPMDPNGVFDLASGEGVTSAWTLRCDPGWMPDPAIGVSALCTPNGTLTNQYGHVPLPSCLPAPSCRSPANIHENVTLATGNNCSLYMSDADKCMVSCVQGYSPLGEWTCVSGTIRGRSICYNASDPNLIVKDVAMVSGTIRISCDMSSHSLEKAIKALERSIAAALGVPGSDVLIASIEEARIRRLAATAVERRLQVMFFDVSYEVYVPDGMDPSVMLAKMSDLATPGSPTANAFLLAMKKEDLPVSSIEFLYAPRQYQTGVVLSADGNLFQATTPTTTTTEATTTSTPELEEDEGAPIGAIIGGLVGGLCCSPIFVFCIYKVVKLVQKRRNGKVAPEVAPALTALTDG